MAICGHQFRAGDEADWIWSTSANFLGGSSTAKQILQELFKKHYANMTTKPPKIHKQETINPHESPISENKQLSDSKTTSKSSNNSNHLIVKKISGSDHFENFDESQHLNGCPIKWLYDRRLLERNKKYKVTRWCSKTSAKKKELKKDRSSSNLRDRTPIEVKIHRINLAEKYGSGTDESEHLKMSDKSEEWENRKKKLAAKLNWKLHDESSDDSQLETSSDIRSNYLPPRPLLGLKPLLSILLAPQQESPCCSVTEHLKENSAREEKIEASLSIQSLDLPIFIQKPNQRPKTTHTPRWGTKSSKLQKRTQIPNQVSIDIQENQKSKFKNRIELKSCQNLPMKKFQEKTTRRSLSSLFYELKDKTNQNEEYFEEMIRNLTMEEDQFKIKRFLNSNLSLLDSVDKKERRQEEMSGGCPVKSDLNLVCGKARIFKKISKLSAKKMTER